MRVNEPEKVSLWLVIAGLALAAICVVAIAGWRSYFPSTFSISAAPNYISRQIFYSFTVRNKSGELLKDSIIEIFAPVEISARQKAGKITASEPFSLKTDGHGNQVLSFSLTLPPYATSVLSIEAVITVADQPIPDTSLPDLSSYLLEEELIQVKDPAVVSFARSLSAPSPQESAGRISDWISVNLRDGGYARENRGALFALSERVGDCSEYAALFVAAMRSLGVPARLMGGFVLGTSNRLVGRTYHNWAEFRNGNIWEIADPFLKKDSNANADATYVPMRIVFGGKTEKAAHSQRFLSFDPRLEVSME